MLLIWSDPRPSNPHHATRMFCLCGVNTIRLYLQETVLLGNILFGVISFVFKLLLLMYMYNTPVTIVVIHMHQDIIRKIFEMTVNCLLSFISSANWKWFAMSRDILKGFSYHMISWRAHFSSGSSSDCTSGLEHRRRGRRRTHGARDFVPLTPGIYSATVQWYTVHA